MAQTSSTKPKSPPVPPRPKIASTGAQFAPPALPNVGPNAICGATPGPDPTDFAPKLSAPPKTTKRSTTPQPPANQQSTSNLGVMSEPLIKLSPPMRGTNPLDFDLSSLDPLRNPNLGFDAFLPQNKGASSAQPPPPAVCNPTYGTAPNVPTAQPPALNRNTTQGAFANFGAQTIGQTPNNSNVSTVVPYGGTLGRNRPETSTTAQFGAGNYNTIQVARGSKTSVQQGSNPTRAISPPVDRPTVSATNNAFAAFGAPSGANFGASSSNPFGAGSGTLSGATFGEQSGAGFGSGSGTPIGSGTGTPVTESFGALVPSTSAASLSPSPSSTGRPPSDLMDFSAFNEIEEEFMTLESFDPLLSSAEQTGSTNGNDAMENLAFFADSAESQAQQGASAASSVEAFKPPSVPSASPAHMTGMGKYTPIKYFDI